MRRLAAGIGLAAAGLGLAIVAGVPIRLFSMQEIFITLVGLLALFQGGRYASDRFGVEPRATQTGDPELRNQVPVPGDDADASLGLPRELTDSGSFRREDVRNRFRSVAVETMVARRICNRKEAESRIASGEWTDDPIASRFLADDSDPIPLRTRLGLLLRRESAYAHGVHRSLAEIERLQEEAG